MLTSIIDFVKSPRLLLALALSTVSAALVAGPLAYRAIEVRANDSAAQSFDSTTIVPGDDLADVATTSPTSDDDQPTPTISVSESGAEADAADEQVSEPAGDPESARAGSSSNSSSSASSQPQPDHDESSITILRDPPDSSASDDGDESSSTTAAPDVADSDADDGSTTADTSAGGNTETTDDSPTGDDPVTTTVLAEEDVEPTIVASSAPVESIGADGSTTSPESDVAAPTEPEDAGVTDTPAAGADDSQPDTTVAPADETTEVPTTLNPEAETTASTDSTSTDVTPTEPKTSEPEASTGFAGSAGGAEDAEPSEVFDEDLDLSDLVNDAPVLDSVSTDEDHTPSTSDEAADEVSEFELGDETEHDGMEGLEQLETEATSVVAGSTPEPSPPDAELAPLVSEDGAAEPTYEQAGAGVDS